MFLFEAVWQVLLPTLCRQKQDFQVGNPWGRGGLWERAQATSMHMRSLLNKAATSPRSTLPASSIYATNSQAHSLLFQPQSVPWVCTAPRSALLSQLMCQPSRHYLHSPQSLLPGLISCISVSFTSILRPRYLPFHRHLRSIIHLHPLTMLMPSWCGHRDFLICQRLRENTGGGKSEDTSFLSSTPGWGWRGGKPAAAGHGRRQTLPQADRQVTACAERGGQENLLPSAVQAGSTHKAFHLSQVAKLSYTSYVMTEERR